MLRFFLRTTTRKNPRNHEWSRLMHAPTTANAAWESARRSPRGPTGKAAWKAVNRSEPQDRRRTEATDYGDQRANKLQDVLCDNHASNDRRVNYRAKILSGRIKRRA